MTQAVMVSKRAQEVQDLLSSNSKQFQRMLPSIISPEQFLSTSIAALQDNPELMECSVPSLIKSLLFCAQLGLVPGARQHVFLIPFQNRQRGVKEVQVITSYQGLLTLVRRSKQIARVNASVVLQGDFFTHSQEPPDLHHEKNSSFWGKLGKEFDANITHVYALAVLNNQQRQQVVWPVDRVRAHRDRYAKSKAGPWADFFEQMAVKTVLRELCGLLPTEDIDMAQVIRVDKQAEAGERQSFDFSASFLDEAPVKPSVLQEGATEQPAQAKAAKAEQEERVFHLPFAPKGRTHCLNKPINDPAVTLDDLSYYAQFFEKSINNPGRKDYKQADEEALKAIREELKRRA